LQHGKQLGVCTRLAEVRAEHFGPRGKSRFARELGIGSSTYDRYERDRTPPADLLLKAARITGVRLEWLITGEGPREGPPALSERIVSLIERLRDLLRRRQDLADQVDVFLTDLERRSAT